MKKWKLRKSRSQCAIKPCVIKLKKNNLWGAIMELNKLGNNEFCFEPTSVGIFRVLHNIDRTKGAVKGCYLVYCLEEEKFLRYLFISDEDVKKLSNDEIQNSKFINDLAKTKRLKHKL